MAEKKFTNELKQTFDYIKNTILKEYDCDKIFETLNDSIAETVINLHNVNYYPLIL